MSCPTVKRRRCTKASQKKWTSRRAYIRFLLEFDYIDMGVLHSAALEMGIESPLRIPSPAPRRSPKAGIAGVYVLKGADGLYKIGSSRDAAKRTLALQTGSSVPLELVHVIPTKQHLHTTLERRLHKRLASKHVRGEWFSLTTDDINALRLIKM